MNRVLVSPGRIILGDGALSELGSHAAAYGKRALLIASGEDGDRVWGAIGGGAQACGVELVRAGFQGECSESAVDAILREADGMGFGCVIGLGGGKAIDAAKIVGDTLDLPMVSAPTIAATDAPCSALAIVYGDDHIVIGARPLRRSPAVVIVDTGIIAQAPPRYLVSGMGDAFATFFEARACRRSNTPSNGGTSTLCAYALAELCLRTLLEKGREALAACRCKAVTKAFEDIVETNIVMSGIGFESVGVAAAHGLLGPLEALGATHALHGEVVAFGTLVQLVLENAPQEDLRMALGFYRGVGLPTRLADLGIDAVDSGLLARAARLAVSEPDGLVHHMPFDVGEADVAAAILVADGLADIY